MNRIELLSLIDEISKEYNAKKEEFESKKTTLLKKHNLENKEIIDKVTPQNRTYLAQEYKKLRLKHYNEILELNNEYLPTLDKYERMLEDLHKERIKTNISTVSDSSNKKPMDKRDFRNNNRIMGD